MGSKGSQDKEVEGVFVDSTHMKHHETKVLERWISSGNLFIFKQQPDLSQQVAVVASKVFLFPLCLSRPVCYQAVPFEVFERF